MKILVADDDTTTRLTLCLTLSKWGYEVCEASDGNAALQCFNHQNPPAMALLDWMMPGCDGIEACRQIKSIHSNRPPYILILTSKISPADLVDGLNAGADNYISKPYNADELRARLQAGERIVALQHQLADLNQNLEQRVAERTANVQSLLSQKHQLIRQLGHDLRTPLTPLVHLLPELIKQEDNPDKRDSLLLCHEQVQHLHYLADRIRLIARLDELDSTLCPQPTPLEPLIQEAIQQLLQRRSYNSYPSVSIPKHIRILADPTWFQKAVIELLDNALRYSAPQGHVSITASTHNNQLLLRFTNYGCGLDPAELETIFNPFHTGDPSRHQRRTHGLGLAISREIIQHHGGQIWAESQGSIHGASVVISLPIPTETTNETPSPTTITPSNHE